MSAAETLSENESAKPTFCLVHGAWHGAWCWTGEGFEGEYKFVAPELNARGWETISPDLPIDIPEATFDDYARVVADAIIEANPQSVIPVGWSRAGNVITRLPEIIAQEAGHIAIKKLVYVAAAIDESTIGWLPKSNIAEANRKSILYEVAMMQAGEDKTVFPAELAKDTFYHDVPDEVAAWAITKLRPQYRPANQTVIERLPKLRRYYIGCTEDNAIDPMAQGYMAGNYFMVDHTNFRYMTTGHALMLADPVGTVDLLENIAKLE